MEGTILALDYGTTALKAALYDENLRRIGITSREWAYLYPAPCRIEHPAEAYWAKTLSAMNELLDRFDCRRSLIGVSVTGQAETLIALNRDGEALGNAIVWLDTRAQAECARISGEFPPAQLYAATGNTGFDPVMPLAKLNWMKAHEPERYKTASTFLLIKEYIIYRLTGQRVGEYSAQSCSGYFNIVTCDWARDLLACAGIDEEKLPPLYGSQHVVGCLCASARQATGLSEGIRVVNGMLDQCASSLGAGVIDGTQITETTGTVLAIAAVLNDFDPGNADMLVLRHGLKERYLALPNCSTAGVLLRWFRDEFTPEGTDYDALNREILARARPESGLMFLPHFAGYLSPVNNAQARGVLYGLTLDSTRADVALSIMEGVGFLLRENLELLEKRGICSKRLVSLGGGSHSPVWLRVKADILGREMLTLSDGESTALGCAANAAMALGLIELKDFPALAVTESITRPTNEGMKIYRRKYQNYLALNQRLGFNPPGQVTEV